MIYYIYDPDGDRVKKVSGGATTYYIRGADGSVLEEYASSLTNTYIYTGTQRLAKIADDTTQYYIQDHLGNTRALMADNGTVVSTMDYWPYGTMLSQTGSGDTRFKYTGHERDDESALDYMLARMYEHETGRSMQMDPLADKYPGISPYVYAAGNPLKFVDPDGKEIRVAGWIKFSYKEKEMKVSISSLLGFNRAVSPTFAEDFEAQHAKPDVIHFFLPGRGTAPEGANHTTLIATGSQMKNLIIEGFLTEEESKSKKIIITTLWGGEGYVDVFKGAAHELDHGLDLADTGISSNADYRAAIEKRRGAEDKVLPRGTKYLIETQRAVEKSIIFDKERKEFEKQEDKRKRLDAKKPPVIY